MTPTNEDNEKYADKYRRKYFIDQYLKSLNKIFQTTQAVNLVNFGCGDAYPDQFLQKDNNVHITGIDNNKDKVEKARINNPKGKYSVGNIYETNYKNNEFEIAICLEVLEHLSDYQKAINEMKRVSTGAIISVPWEPYFTILSLLGLRNLKTLGRHPEHINFWNPHTLNKLLSQYYMKVTITKSFPWLFALCQNEN